MLIGGDRDGHLDRIRVDIVRPLQSGPGLKVPAIIDESPYYDNAGRGNEKERKQYDGSGALKKFPLFYDNYFVPRGYAVLHVDMSGTTKSDGCPDMGGRGDVLGGKAVIDWLNGRARAYHADGSLAVANWTTGKAGMIGKSYDGTLATATVVSGLVTIVPIEAISSWYRYVRENGILVDRNYPSFLTSFVDTDPAAKCQAVRDQLDIAADDATGNYNPFWAERDYLNGSVANISKLRASVFAVPGMNDLNVQPDNFSTLWQQLAQRGIPRKVWISQYGHVDPFDFEGRRDLWVDTLHQWFDYWLQVVQNAIMAKPRADVQVSPTQWITQSNWPANTNNIELRPAANGSLGLFPAFPRATASFTDVEQSEDEMIADIGTTKPNRVAFTTGTLSTDLRLSGTPSADLRVKLDKPTANLTALLVDLGTDTRIDFQEDYAGITTLDAEDCHGESTADDDGCYKQVVGKLATVPAAVVVHGFIDVQNRNSLTTSSPLAVGTYAQVKWQTLPHDYIFHKGHRIALVIAGTDVNYTYDFETGAKVTLDLSKSAITVPFALSAPLTSLPAGTTTYRGPGVSALVVPQPQRLSRLPSFH